MARETVHLAVSATFEVVAGNNFKDLLDHTVDTETIDVSEVIAPITLEAAGK